MPETQTAIILVTDLVGSTARRSELGEEAAEELRRRHDGVLGEAISAVEGQVVKSLGDGVLARFSGAADAVAAAVAIQQAVDGEFDVRIGISAGDVTIEDGDCFGTPVIEASRLCDRAIGGQILVADLARMLARGRGGHEFRPIGELELKGLPEPVVASEVGWERVASDAVPFPAGLRSTGGFPFAGRAQVVERVERLWKEATSGAAGVLLLSGEPGMGKTRLSSELAAKAQDDRATVLFGRSDEEITSPYRPFSEALAPLVAHLPDTELESHIDTCGGALAVVVQTLGSRRPDAAVPEGSADEIRLAVFDAVADLLSRAARIRPVLLVLDDLHWADDPSLLLLKHLARIPELGAVLLVGTYRDTDLVRGHRLSSVLADLRRVEGAERVDLDGLDEGEVAELMRIAGGHDLDERGLELARVVHHETEGNPFFVGEILRHLAESGAIYESGGRWVSDAESVADIGVPQGIREVVGRRLDALSDEANAVLRTAAVIGQDFELGVLAGAVGQDEDDVIDLLDDALSRGLVAEVPGQVDRLRFPHALVRQTLYEELSASRRVRIHAKVAGAYAALTRPSPAERAHHLLEAAAVSDLEVVADAAITAAESALAANAWETAEEWLDRALEALVDVGDDLPHLRARVLLTLARARNDAGDFRSARDALTEAVQLARRVEDPGLLADITITYAFAGSSWLDLGDTFGLELVTETEALLPPGDSVDRAHVLVAKAFFLTQSPDADVVSEAARKGLEMVRRTSSPRLIEALQTRSEALRGSPNVDELLETARETLDVDHPTLRYYGLYHEGVARLKQGRLTDVERIGQESLEAARRTRSGVFAWQGHSALACVHACRAAWDEAREALDRANELAEVVGETSLAVRSFQESFLALMRGDTARSLAEISELFERHPVWALWPGEVVLGDEDGTMGADELGAAASRWFDLEFPALPHWVKIAALGIMAGPMRHASNDVATRALEIVQPSSEVWLVAGVNQHDGHAGWTIGALAEAQDDLDRAVTEYQRAADAHLASGEIPMRARRLVWLVEALLRRNASGDRDRAARLIDEIATTAECHGIAGLADRATALVS